jgi:hypothetical protein
MRAALLMLVVSGATRSAAQDTTRLLRGALFPAVRAAPAASYVSTESFAGSFSHNVRSNGSVVVLHATGRRVLVLDSTLALSKELFNATTPAPLTFPPSDARLYQGLGDSTYFFDRSGHAFRVIGPDGNIVRRQPITDSASFATIVTNRGGRFDGKGRLIVPVPQEKRVPTGKRRELRDSVYLIRFDFAMGTRDTVATLYYRQSEMRGSGPVDSLNQGPTVTRVVPMFDFGDAWALTSRNEIMILRAEDYSVSWLGADGRWRQTARLPWPRNVIPAAVKPRMLEQARAAAARNRPVPDLTGNSPVGSRIVVQVDDSVGDRVPVFWPMSASADHDGGFWLLVGTPTMGRAPGVPTFLHVDAQGKMIDQVSIPAGRYMQGVTRDGFLLVWPTPEGGKYERVVLPPR